MRSLVCRAVDTVKNSKGQTIGYVLEDGLGERRSITTSEIKRAIASKQVTVTNLKLTINNRLIKENMNIPSWFSNVANRIADMTNTKCTEPRIDKFRLRVDFKDTPVSLYGLVDGSKDMFLYDKKLESQSGRITADSLRNYIGMITRYSKPIKVPVQSNNDLEVYYVSDIHKDQKAWAEKHDFEIGGPSTFKSKRDGRSIVIIYNEYARLAFFDSKFANIKVMAEENTGYAFKMINCTVDTLISNNVSVITQEIVVNNIVKAYNCEFKTDNKTTYINELEVNISEDCVCSCDFQLNKLIANKLTIVNNNRSSVLLKSLARDFICVRDINIQGKNRVTLDLNGLLAENINISADRVLASIDNTWDYYQNAKNAIYSWNNNNCSVLCGALVNDLSNLKMKININSNSVSFGRMLCYADITPAPSFELADNGLWNFSLAVDFFKTQRFKTVRLNGLIGLTRESNIYIDNLLVGHSLIGDKSQKEKGIYGFGFMEVEKEGFNKAVITIGNTIKMARKTNIKEYKAIMYQLREISQYNPINTYFGTQAYSVLKSENVKMNILNKEDIPKNLVNRAMKEQLLGKSMVDIVYDAVNAANSSQLSDNTSNCPVDNGVGVEIPDEIIDYFKLQLDDNCSTTTYKRAATLISLIKLLPISNLPFTRDIIRRMKKDNKFVVSSLRLCKFDSIKFYIINIGYLGIKGKVDRYAMIANGKKLIHMAYIGTAYCKVQNLYEIEKVNECIEQLHKLDKVDFVNYVIEQSLTLTTFDEIRNFIPRAKNIIDFGVTYLWYDNILITFGNENNMIIFKTTASMEKTSAVNRLDMISYPERIDSITSVDNKELKNVINKIDREYKQSLLFNINTLVKEDNDTEEGKLPCAEISTYYQIAHRIFTDGNIVSADTIADILSLPYFEEIEQERYYKILKNSEYKCNIDKDDSFDIWYGNIKKNTKRSLNDISLKGIVLIRVAYNYGLEQYYIGDTDIVNLVRSLQKLGSYQNSEYMYSVEDYIKDFSYLMKKWYDKNGSVGTTERIARQFNNNNRGYKYIIDIYGISEIIKENIENGIYTAEHYIDLFKMDKYRAKEFKDDLGKINKSITDDDIYNAGITQELLDLVHNDTDKLNRFREAYENYKKFERASFLLRDATEKVFYFNVTDKSSSRHKSSNTTTIECLVCGKNGTLYLMIKRGRVTIPIMRIRNFKDAMILRKQLSVDIDDRSDWIASALFYLDNKNLQSDVSMQFNNDSNKDDYMYEHGLPFIAYYDELKLKNETNYLIDKNKILEQQQQYE